MHADPLQLVGSAVEGRYDVAEYIEQRGSRFVYRAVHRHWGEPVAVAFHCDDPSTPPQVREEAHRGYLRAGALMSRLASRSTAFVQARDAGVLQHARGELPYNVYEWIEGATLFEVLETARSDRPPRMGLASSLEWFAEPIRALLMAHESGIVHGRIDPHNLFVVGGSFHPPGLLKIRGFTNAAWQTCVPTAIARPLPTDPLYEPPELATPDHAARVGPWTDVYGLAAVLVELVVGRPVHDEPVGPLIEPYVPRHAQYALQRALSERTEERFRTMVQFHQALLEGMGVAAGRAKAPRRTMVVADQLSEHAAPSAGAFETSGEDFHEVREPDPDAPRPRVRLAFTQRMSAADPAPKQTPRPAPRRTVVVPTEITAGATAPRAASEPPSSSLTNSGRRASDSFTSGIAHPQALQAASAAMERTRLIVIFVVVALVMGMAGYLVAQMMSA